jgi:hypothetical protein
MALDTPSGISMWVGTSPEDGRAGQADDWIPIPLGRGNLLPLSAYRFSLTSFTLNIRL